jgi:MOB kinase activator 1
MYAYTREVSLYVPPTSLSSSLFFSLILIVVCSFLLARSGNMRAAVALPIGEDMHEWLASNSVDFFNEISLIWGIVNESGVIAQGPGEGFPPGFEYLWADGVTVKTPIRCSAPQYIDYVMTWVEEHINNEAVFPSSPGTKLTDCFVLFRYVLF